MLVGDLGNGADLQRGGKPIFHNFAPFTSEHSSQCKFHQTSKTAILIFFLRYSFGCR